MILSRTTMLASISTLALAMASAVQAKSIDNAEFKTWSKFKVGATCKLESTAVSAGQTAKSTTTTKLVELTADKAVVETTLSMNSMGQDLAIPPQKREIPAKLEVADNTPDAPVAAGKADAKTTEESVKVGDKEIKCKVVETDTDANGMKAHSKLWTSEEVPGSTVKLESKTTSPMESSTTTSLISFTTGG